MWTIALTHVDWPWRLFLNSTASPHALKGSRLILSKAEVRSFRKMKKNGLDTESSQRAKAPLSFCCFSQLLLSYTFISNSDCVNVNTVQIPPSVPTPTAKLSLCLKEECTFANTAHSKDIISPLLQVISLLYLQMGICCILRQHDWAPHKWILEVKTVVACRDVTKHCIRCTV